ncbi:hypothetical protein HK405_012118, partial [Cladochytrium tenue]
PMLITSVSIRDVPRGMLKDAIGSTSDDVAFQIVHAQETITVKAPNAAAKARWMAAYEQAIRAAQSGTSR